MRRAPVRIMLAVCVPWVLAAQGTQDTSSTQRTLPRPEIGVRGGYMHFSQHSDFGSESFSMIAMPAGAFGPAGGIHAAVFLSPRFALEPQVGLIRFSQEGSDAFTTLMLAMQANGFLGPDATKSPYLFAQLGRLEQDNGGSSEGQTTFGGGLGYRKVHRESIAMRYELRYRHWTGQDITMNEFGVLVGVAAVIR